MAGVPWNDGLGGWPSDNSRHERGESAMKIEVNNESGLTAKEVFNGLVLETAEGNMLTVCMRDDTVEMPVVGTGRWFRADMD
jgi:hypothetical protein